MSRTVLRTRLRGAYDLGCRALVRFVPEPLLPYVWHNPLFDRRFYLATYPDVARARVHPERHYRRHGVREGRNPNALFRTSWYLRTYHDVAASSLNPLDHYYFHGGHENRDPSPLFRSAWYRSRNPEVRGTGINPLLHYMRNGIQKERPPPSRGSRSRRASHRAPAHGAWAAATSGLRRQIERLTAGPDPLAGAPPDHPVALVIDNAYPRPDRGAGSLLTFNLVRLLRALGYQVVYVPATGISSPANADHLRATGATVLRRAHARSIPALLGRIGERLDLVVLSRVDSGGTFIDEVRRYCRTAKVLFNTVDLHWLRLEREAALLRDRVAMYRAMETREREIYVTRLSDATLVVSTAEKALLESSAPGARVVWWPIIHDVLGCAKGYETRSGLAFIGGYLHRPNVDAVQYFLDEIWPRVRASSPDARFFAIGPNMPESLATRRDPGFVPVGEVPDVSASLAQVRLTVAPLRFGAGAKGKVITSLAHGVPCVLTPIAAEGISLGADDAVVASDPKSFADAVVEVYTDPVRWASLSARGMAWVGRTQSVEVGARQLADTLRAIGAPAGAGDVTATRSASPPAARR